MFNQLRSKEAATISAVLALGLGVTACGDSSSTEGKLQINQPATAVANTKSAESSFSSSGAKINVQYYNDGTRKITFNGVNAASIFDFCDGPDLVEETENFEGNGRNNYANSMSRSVDYPGCADGKLTPSDFQLDSSK